MAIRRRNEVVIATCDGCGRSLKDRSENVHCAEIVHRFGYGSFLDEVCAPEPLALCEYCYLKATLALGLPVNTSELVSAAKRWAQRHNHRILDVDREGVMYEEQDSSIPHTADWKEVLSNWEKDADLV